MAESIADAVWVKRLSGNRAGRLLSQHLSCLELQSKSKARNCAVLEAINNEKVFINALARSLARAQALPCNLSQPLPRFIGVLNLSGERSLVYTDNPALLRCVCTHSSRMNSHDLHECLTAFEAFPMAAPSAKSSRFVLLTYSLPWQAGTDAAFWHLSACETTLNENGVGSQLKDRILHVSSVSETLFKGKSLLDPTDQYAMTWSMGEQKPLLKVVTEKEIAAFKEDYSATNLDFEGDACAECAETAENPPSKREVLLNGIVHTLKQEQTQDRQEIRLLKDAKKALESAMELAMEAADTNTRELADEHKRELDAHKKKAKDMLEVSRMQNDAFSVEIVRLKEDKKKLSTEKQEGAKEFKKLQAKHKQTVNQGEAKDALHNAALSKHLATITRLEGQLSTKDARIKEIRLEMQHEQCAALDKAHRERDEAVERLTGALESKKRIINQLSENNDRKDVEKESLQTHADEQAGRILALEISLAKLEAELQTRREAEAAAPKMRSKSVGTHGRTNASTATHHCASTQTAPPPASPPASATPTPTPPSPSPVPAPEPVVASKVGVQVLAVENSGPQAVAPCSYQAAIDMLQELVNLSGHQSAQPAVPMPTMPAMHAMPAMPAMPAMAGSPGMLANCSRPLPFPHFTPMAMYAPNGQFHQAAPSYAMTAPGHAFHAQPQPQPQPQQQKSYSNHAHAKGYVRSM